MALIGGADVTYGGQTAISGYIVVDETTGPSELVDSKIKDTDGTMYSILNKDKYAMVTLELILTTGTLSEFVEGNLCTATGFTTYRVESVTKKETEDETRATVVLKDYNL